MIKKYSEVLLQNRWLTIILVLVCLIGTLGGFQHLKTNYHMRYWLETEDHLIKKLNYFEDNFGNDEAVVIAVYSSEGILNPENLKLIKTISQRISELEDVKSIQSLSSLKVPKISSGKKIVETQDLVDFENFNVEETVQKINSIDLIPNLFISKDYKTSLIFANLKPTIIKDSEVFDEIDYRRLTSSLRTISNEYSHGNIEIHVSGSPILQNDFSAVSEKDLALIMPLLFTFLSLVLYGLFRSIKVVIMAVTIISITNTFVYAIIGLLGFQIENMLSIVPLITLTICLADIVHIYMTYQKEMNLNSGKLASIKTSIKDNFVPTFLTSLTTGVGFFSLFNSKLVPVSNMGIMSGIGVFIAWILSISLFPVFLSFTKESKYKKSKILIKADFKKLVVFSKKYQGIVLGLFFMMTIIGTYIGTQNKINTDPITFFKEGTQIRKATDFIISKVGAVTGPEIIIHSGYREGVLEPEFLKKVDSFGAWLKENKYTDRTISIVDLGKEIYKKLNNDDPKFYKIPDSKKELIDLIFDNRDALKGTMNLNSRVSNDFESIRFSLLWSLTETRSSLDRLDIITKKAKEMGLSMNITGKNALYLKMNDHVVNTFFTSIGAAIISISILMVILFKSFKFGFIAMLPNLVPLSFIMGIMTVSGIYIDIGTALVCSVCLGIAVDDTIHFMINYYRERKKGLSIEDSLESVLNHTGKALMVTSFILVIGFGFFMLSQFIPNIKFGFLCSLTLLIALVTDFVLLPAVILKLDK
ncbi:MAG: putative RND superfamily exporter protein [Bacteriovoracaceae bacterium]|jgi:predicted RND superfamily exporter protein